MKNKIALSIFLILGIFSFAEEEGKWKGAYNGENSYYFGENTWVDGSNTYSIGNNNYIYGNNNQVHGDKNKVGGENSRIDNNLVFGNNNEIYPDPVNKATREYKVFLAVELPSGQNVGGVRSIREGEKVKFNGSVDGAKLVWWNNDIEKPIRNNSIIFGRFIENDKTETKQEELHSKLSLLISFTEEIVKGSKKFLKSSDEEKEEILENVEEVIKRASNNHGKSEYAMKSSIKECEDILKIFTEGEPKQNDTPNVNITENKSKPDFIGNIIKGNNNLVIGQGNAVFGANVHLGEKNKSSVNNNIILGSNITNTDVNNAIVFGNESKPIEGAVSIGNDTTTRQIKYVKAGVEDTDAVNVSQLKDYLKVDDKNKFLKSEDVDIKGDTYIKVTPDENKHNHYALTFNKDKLGENLDISKNSAITNINTKLDEKANLDATNVKGDSLTKWQNVLGTGTIDNNNTGLVTGGVVKTYVDSKLKGKLSSDDVKVTGDTYIKVTPDENKHNHYDLTFNKDKLASDLDLTKNNSINNMFTTKLGGINTNISDLITKVDNNTNSINSLKTTVEDNTNKITNLTTKVDTNTKDIDTLKQDMTKKLNVDADNLTAKGETNLIDKLSKGSDISKPNNKLVTDIQVNEHLSKNYYNKTEVDAKVSNISNTVVEANKKSELALGGVANAVAMANLPQVGGDRKYNLAASYGYYGGSHAVAVGFSGTNDKQNFTYKLSGSVNSKGNLALGIGAGVMMGSVDNKDKRIEELTNEVKELRKENMEIKTLLRKIIKK